MADHPDIALKPPFILLTFLIAGGAGYYYWPFGWGLSAWGVVCGILMIGAAVKLMITCLQEFKAAETNISVHEPTETILTEGPYSWSRNPVYIAGSLLYLGIGITIGNGWILALYLPFFLVLNLLVIDREEAYLAEKFGEDYMEYQSLVRRWL